MDDSELLDAARKGDGAAFETFVERHQHRVLRFGLSMCGDSEDARDVAQETLFAAARGLAAFRRASSPSTWLYTIARSYCIKKRRRRSSEPSALVSLERGDRAAAERVRDPGRSPDQALEDARLRDALEGAIAALDPKQREVLVLRDVEGLASGDVAEITGLSVDAVKSRLHRARMALRERLTPVLGRAPAPAPACPDVVRLFSRKVEGEIGPAACAEMERHLAACPRCEAACASLKRTLGLCRELPAPVLPAGLRNSIRKGIRAFLSGQPR